MAASTPLLLRKVEDGGHSRGLEQAVLVLQPSGEAVFGEMFTAEKGVLSGGPVIPLHSFQPLHQTFGVL